MKCLFSSLQFGDIATLGDGVSFCKNCGADTQSLVEQTEWRYLGHSADLDLFEPVSIVSCPTCGKTITGYAQRCEKYGGLQVQISESTEARRLP